MARTYRNKGSLPKGWTVRDDGFPYFNGNDIWGNSLYDPMSRNPTTPRFRKLRYRKEDTYNRREWSRRYRRYMTHMTRIGRWGDILPPRHTEGWDTW